MNRPKLEEYERDVLFYTHNEREEDLERCIKDLDKYIDELETEYRDICIDYRQISKENKDLKNELCFKCGYYTNAHLGACNGCKWYRRNNNE